jgi:hypothetical protein
MGGAGKGGSAASEEIVQARVREVAAGLEFVDVIRGGLIVRLRRPSFLNLSQCNAFGMDRFSDKRTSM